MGTLLIILVVLFVAAAVTEVIIRDQEGPRDVYERLLPRLFARPSWKTPWAITLGQTTYYSVPASQVDSGWRRHEDCHKKQWAREGYLRFAARYIWQLARKGYSNIDYEIEARAAATAEV